MALLRSRPLALFAAVLLGCALACASPARAQMFGELAGGPTLASGPISSTGFNLRASIGWKVASNFSWRIDAFTSQFNFKDNLGIPCPSFGCPASAFIQSERVSALTANGLVNLDARGIFYLIGGAGLYGVNNASETTNGGHFGVSAGAGITWPIGSRLRGVVEARWHSLLGDSSGPSSLIPITIGLRY